MKLHRLPLALLAFSLVFTACQQGAQPLSDEDMAELRSFHDRWVPAMTSGDWDALYALYTEDCVIMPPNQPEVVGRAAARASAEASPRITEAVLLIDEIDGYGDLAFVRGTYSMTMMIEGQPVQDEGKYIEVRRKQTNGSWLISRDIFNSDLPAAPAEGEHSGEEEHR